MSDVARLLLAYEELLERRSVRRGRPWVLGTDAYVLEHVRAVVGALQRHYARRAAIGAGPGASENDDLESLRRFVESLPPRRSATFVIAIGVLIVLVAQALSALLGLFERAYPEARVTSGAQRSELLEALSDIASLSVSNVVSVAEVIIDAGLAGASVVLTVAGLAGWLVLRPLANGVAAARALRDQELSMLERAVLTQAGVRAPTESALDLMVPALVAVPALLIGVTLGREYFDGIEERDTGFGVGETTSVEFIQPAILLLIAITLAAVAWARLTDLARRYLRRRRLPDEVAADGPGGGTSRRRTRPLVWWWLVMTSLLVAGFVAYGVVDTTPTDAEVRLETSIAETLADGQIALNVRSSEPSEFDSAELRGFSGLAPDEGELDQEVSGPEGPAFSDLTEAHVVLLLTAAQRRWLRRESESGEAWLEILLFDDAANETHVRLYLD